MPIRRLVNRGRVVRALLLVSSVCAGLAVGGCRGNKLSGTAIGQYAVHGALESNSCAEGYPSPTELSFFVELRDEPATSVGYWKLPDAPTAQGQLDRAAGTFRFEDRQDVPALAASPADGYPGCVLARVEVVTGMFGARPTLGDAGSSDAGSSDAGNRSDTGPADGGVAADGGAASDAAIADGGTASDGGARRDAAVGSDASVSLAAPLEAAFAGHITVTVSSVPGGDCSPLLDPSQGGFPFLPCEIRYRLGGDRLDEPFF